MAYQIIALDHVQLAMPAGGEEEAESFYCGLLGFTRQPKPEPMASRGGCWFTRGDVVVHLGVEAGFRPAKKAHPAFVVRDLPALEARFAEAGVEVRANPDRPEGAGCHVDDPFGNRIEFIAGSSERGARAVGGVGGRPDDRERH